MRRIGPGWKAMLALAGAGTAAALLLLEFLLRACAGQQWQKRVLLGYWIEKPGQTYDIGENLPPRTAWVRDVWSPYPLFSNELGCFDRPFAGGEHALLLGDSFTQGMLPLESTWGALAEERSGLRILKCGVMGYGTKDELLKARRVLAKTGKRSRLLILGYNMNDLQDDWLFPQIAIHQGYAMDKRTLDPRTGEIIEIPDAALEKYLRLNRLGLNPEACPPGGPFQRLRCFFYDRSVLYRRVRPPLRRLLTWGHPSALVPVHEMNSFWTYGEGSWLERAWRSHLANVAALNRLAKKSGAKLLLVVIPSREQVYRFLQKAPMPGGPALDYDLPNKKLAALAAKEGFSLLDLTGTFRRRADQTPRQSLDGRRDFYWGEDSHWNYRGQRLAGLLLAERLLVDGISPAPDRKARLAAVRAELAEFGR